MLKSKTIVWLFLLLAAGIGAACDAAADEANKFVDEANASIDKYSELGPKATAAFNALMGEKMTQAEDIEQYKPSESYKDLGRPFVRAKLEA